MRTSGSQIRSIPPTSSRIAPTISASATGGHFLSSYTREREPRGDLPLPPHHRPERVEEVGASSTRPWRRTPSDGRWSTVFDPLPATGSASASSPSIARTPFARPASSCSSPAHRTTPGDSARSCTGTWRRSRDRRHADPHHAFQIFHAAWLVDEDGRHPLPTRSCPRKTWSAERGGRPHPSTRNTALRIRARSKQAANTSSPSGRTTRCSAVSDTPSALALEVGGLLPPAVARSSPTRFRGEGLGAADRALLVLGPEVAAGGGRQTPPHRPPLGFDAVSSPARQRAIASPGRSKTCSPTSATSPIGSTCSRTSIRPWSCRTSSTTPTRPTQPFGGSPRRMHIARSTEPIARWPPMPSG